MGGLARSFARAAKPVSRFQETPRRGVSAGGPVRGRDYARCREALRHLFVIKFSGRRSRVHRSLAGSNTTRPYDGIYFHSIIFRAQQFTNLAPVFLALAK
jgi:hypothetical protein